MSAWVVSPDAIVISSDARSSWEETISGIVEATAAVVAAAPPTRGICITRCFIVLVRFYRSYGSIRHLLHGIELGLAGLRSSHRSFGFSPLPNLRGKERRMGLRQSLRLILAVYRQQHHGICRPYQKGKADRFDLQNQNRPAYHSCSLVLNSQPNQVADPTRDYWTQLQRG